jgi:hypothetical protein
MGVSTGYRQLLGRAGALLSFVKPYWADRRVRILTGLALVAMAAAWYWFVAASATLTVAGQHNFRQAEVSIWIDGDLKSTFQVSGAPKKRLGVFQKVGGSFARSMRVGAGDHIVRVRVRSLTDSGDVVRQVHASVDSATDSTIFVNADRAGLSLSAATAPPKTKPEPEESAGYVKVMQSVMMAVAGSALSATVGFIVQDFLRSRKAAAPAAPQQAPTAQ